jgi:hypothetical protein
MTAAVLYGKERLQIETVEVPKIGAGDVLVRVRAALTCGTDVKVFRRGYHARMIVPPALFGHELAGDIVALGEKVQGFQIGQRVMAANSAPCGECYSCRRGQENLCEDLVFNNGAYAEYIVSFRQGCVRRTESGFLLGQEASDRGSADLKPASDLRFADSLPA